MKFSASFKMIRNRLNRDIIYNTPQYWDSKAKDYRGQAISMWPNNALNEYYSREQISIIRRHLNNIQGCYVLDAGCGTGRLSRYLVGLGARVKGIDFSEKTLHEARALSESNNPVYQVQSLFELEDRESFDVIITCASLTVACKNREDALRVLNRFKLSLKASGRILLLEPVHSGFLHRVLNLNLKDFCQVVKEADFNIQEISHLHFWPSRLILAFWNWPKWITALGYHSGEAFLKLTGHRVFGDYISIYATKK